MKTVLKGGNASQWGEANAEYDPEAAHIVLNSGASIPITMYSWDVYLDVEFSKKELMTMGALAAKETTSLHSCRWCVQADANKDKSSSTGNDNGKLPSSLSTWTALSTRLLLRDMKHFGATSSAQIGDAGAVAAVIDPSAIKTRRMHVAVEMRGEKLKTRKLKTWLTALNCLLQVSRHAV